VDKEECLTLTENPRCCVIRLSKETTPSINCPYEELTLINSPIKNRYVYYSGKRATDFAFGDMME
jgi:hypothetical protein